MYVNYIKKVIKEFDNIEIKLIDGNLIDGLKENEHTSIYLSKTLKMMSISPRENYNNYAIIKDNEFKNICDEFFERLWNKKYDSVLNDKVDMLEKIEKTLICKKFINESLKNEEF